jgi:hypothetical protein
MNSTIVFQHIKEALYSQRAFLTLEEISLHSNSGVEYAAGILYAQSLGFKIYGKIPTWILKLTKSPQNVHPQLISRVRELLKEVSITLTENGELILENQHD